MRIQLLSDLHLEFHADGGRSFLASLDPAGIDILVLAGDIGNADTIVPSLATLCARFQDATVVFVAGNHEYYGSRPPLVNRALRELEAVTPNLRFLDCEAVDIGGTTIAGATLWFPDDPLNPAHAHRMSDFSVIGDFVPWVYEQCDRARTFLRQAAPRADLVVTHHIPTQQVVSPLWLGNPLNRFFVCETGDLIESAQPPLWLFGHTHSVTDRRLGATRLMANPMGYPGEPNPGFDDRLVLEV